VRVCLRWRLLPAAVATASVQGAPLVARRALLCWCYVWCQGATQARCWAARENGPHVQAGSTAAAVTTAGARLHKEERLSSSAAAMWHAGLMSRAEFSAVEGRRCCTVHLRLSF
jgi:hypothetical protein